MNVLRFQARSSAEAIRQIRSQLGAEAVVLSVMPLPAKGFSRLWRRPGLEVLAGLPDEPQPEAALPTPEPLTPLPPRRAPVARLLDERAGEPDPFADSPHQEADLRRAPLTAPAEGRARCPQRAVSAPEASNSADTASNQRRAEDSAPGPVATQRSAPVPGRSNAPLPVGSETIQHPRGLGAGCARGRARSAGNAEPSLEPLSSAPTATPWRTATLLQQMGLQPLCIDQVFERVHASYGDQPPVSFAEEFSLVKAALSAAWQPPQAAPRGFTPVHVFIGPPGSGKTTALCKWLAKSVLVERQMPRLWRLDARTAHFAGLLDFYSEIFNVPLEREWRGLSPVPGFDLGFIDLPGTNPQDPVALQQLRVRLQAIPAGQVHLVLNAAYEVPVLLAQVRAFAALPVSDLILTHLDEEKRRGKLWNLILGTNLPVRFLSGGQNIPGEFSPATPEQLFSR